MSDNSDKFTHAINQALDEQTDHLTPEVMQSLQAARQKALSELEAGPVKEITTPNLWQQWLAGFKADPKPTYAFASFASIALVAVLSVNSLTSDTVAFKSDSALAMLDEELSEDVELLEDLEFALWLAESGETL